MMSESTTVGDITPSSTSPEPNLATHAASFDNVKRDELFWADEVHVVLIAQDTAFRVPKQILSDASPIFKDMFQHAQPGGEGEESLFGCPVVRVSDSAVDFRRFLQVVVNVGKEKFVTGPIDSWTKDLKQCSVLNSIIRVAHKYEATDLVVAAADAMERIFNYGRLPYYWWMVQNSNWYWTNSITTRREDAFEVANLARIIDRPRWLPIALYVCCLGDPSHLRDGITRDDGMVERLSDDNFARCVRALPLLGALCCETEIRTLDPERPHTFRDCGAKDGRCKKWVEDTLATLVKGPMRPNLGKLSASDFMNPSVCDREMCSSCWGWLLEHAHETRSRSINERLPGCFGLDKAGKPLQS